MARSAPGQSVVGQAKRESQNTASISNSHSVVRTLEDPRQDP